MSDLEQRIKEAAEKAVRLGILNSFLDVASPANILALLTEKDAEVERLTHERNAWTRIADLYLTARRRDAEKARNALVKGE